MKIHVDRGLLCLHDISSPPVPMRLIHVMHLSVPRLLTDGVQAIFEALVLRRSDADDFSA